MNKLISVKFDSTVNETTCEKSVIAVAYAFPPDVASGSIRNLKILKRLGDCGWKLRVLTVQGKSADTRGDQSLQHEIPGDIEVIRTRCFHTHEFLVGLKSLLTLQWLRGVPRPAGAKFGSVNSAEHNGQRPRALKEFVENLLSIPDKYVGWLPFGVFAGAMSLRRKQVDVIYSVGKPWTCFLVGYFLKLLFRRPLIVDFMDPWQASQWRLSKGKLEGVQSWLERFVVRNADFVIANTPELAEDFVRRLSVPNNRVFVLTSGYDPDDFDSTSELARELPRRFTITHTGSFYKRRTPLQFLKAVKWVLDQRLIPHEALRINFIGNLNENGIELTTLLNDPVLSKVIHRESWVPHADAIRYLKGSDVLLLVQPDTRLQIPAKLYEYACSGQPILALVDKGGAADNLICREGWGRSVRYDDVPEIAGAVSEMYEDFRTGRLRGLVTTESLCSYSIGALAKKLSQVLDVAAGHATNVEAVASA